MAPDAFWDRVGLTVTANSGTVLMPLKSGTFKTIAEGGPVVATIRDAPPTTAARPFIAKHAQAAGACTLLLFVSVALLLTPAIMARGRLFGSPPTRSVSGQLGPRANAGVSLPRYASAVFFGDSIAAGAKAGRQPDRWTNLLSALTGAATNNQGRPGTVLQNSPALSGAPLAGNGRDTYATRVLGSNKQAAAFVAYGFNDARYTAAPATFNVKQYIRAYREVLNGMIIGGYVPTDIYVGSPYYITDTGLATGSTGFSGQTRSRFEAFVAATEQVAAEYGTNYCDLYSYGRDNGFGLTTTRDGIHPDAVGHRIIYNAWRTQTKLANARAKPASVRIISARRNVTVTVSPVPGAASYEYALMQNPVDAASNATGIFNVTKGTYHARARALFGDASKGPWAFAPIAVIIP
jgi:lysophospholipase L1-like esterase